MFLLVVVFSFILLVGDTVAKEYFAPSGSLNLVPSGLYDRINPGDTFYLYGVVGDDVKNFSVFFIASAKAHVLAHFEFKYTENAVIFDTQKDGVWSKEKHRMPNPIPKNQRFIAEFQFFANNIRFILGESLVSEHAPILPIDLMDAVSVDGLTVYDWFLTQTNYGNNTILQIPSGSFKEEQLIYISGYPGSGLYSIGFMIGNKNTKYFAIEGDANRFQIKCNIGGVVYDIWQIIQKVDMCPIVEMKAFDMEFHMEYGNEISIWYNGKKEWTYKNPLESDYTNLYEMFHFMGIQATYVNFGMRFVW